MQPPNRIQGLQGLQDKTRTRELGDDMQLVKGMQAPSVPPRPPMPPQQPPMPPQQPPMAPQEDEKKTLVGRLLNKKVQVADGSISTIGEEIAEARIDKMPPIENALQAMLPQSNTVNQMVDQSRNTVTAAQGGGLMQLICSR